MSYTDEQADAFGPHEDTTTNYTDKQIKALRETLQISPIKWTETRKPDADCSYTHVIGETPFGRILITWKGWKEHDWPTIDESPWGWMTGGVDVEATKKIVEKRFADAILSLLGDKTTT